MKAVFFDLDGTLLDTAPDFALVINRMRQRHGHQALPFEAIRNTVSHGARALISLAFSLQEGDENFDEYKQELLDLYLNNLAEETVLFPGLNELLHWLEQQQISWGIVTNKPRAFTSPILQAFELTERCHAVICPDDVKQTKPHPEPLLLAAKQVDCDPGQAIYIGDHRRDIEAGRAAGMTTVAASYGYIDENDPATTWQADFEVDHPEQLLPLLQRQLMR
jgi:phosphoglycolate phosphatase